MRRGDGIGHVTDQVAETDGVLQGPVEHRVDVADRLGGQALAVPPGVGEEGGVEGAEVRGGEPLRLDVPGPPHDMGPACRTAYGPSNPGTAPATGGGDVSRDGDR
jgi:hypothetical protein